MEMTFDQYIANPMGIKNAVFSNKDMYRNLYLEKLDKILVREVGKVSYTLFIDDASDTYYCHMKVPSEVIDKFYYDTIIKFYTTENDIRSSKSLSGYYVKFYSNDPSFVFTFAYAMLSNGVFIKELVPRMSKEAVTKAAKERNPKNEVGYVKSIFFTYLLMKKYNLFDKIMYRTYGRKFSIKELLNNTTHADIKINERIKLGEELQEKKKKEKEKKKSQQKINSNIATNNIAVTTISNNIKRNVKEIKSTKTVSKISNSIKKTSYVKKI